MNGHVSRAAWMLWGLSIISPFIVLESCDRSPAASPPTAKIASLSPENPGFFSGAYGVSGEEKLVVSADGSVAYLLANGHLYHIKNGVATEIQPPTTSKALDAVAE